MAKPPVASPLLPPFLVSILSDGHHSSLRIGNPYADWTPPPHEWVARNRAALQRNLDALKASLQPTHPEIVRRLLAKFAQMKGGRERSPAEWKLTVAEHLRLLGDYPADIWLSACDEFALSNQFFPDVSELSKLMAPRLRIRHQQISRLEQMLSGGSGGEQEPVVDRQAVMGGLTVLKKMLRSGEIGQLTETEAKRAIRKAKRGEA